MRNTVVEAKETHVNLYQGFTNRVTGEHFRVVSESRESITFHWTVQPHGYVPFEHIHLNQDEVFHIRQGEARIVVDGRDIIARPGDMVRVPKGKPHIAFNNKPEILDCHVSFEPALDSYKFFQCFGGLTIDNDMDRRGEINIPKMLYFTKRMNARCLSRPTKIPAGLFGVAMSFSYVLGKLLGWEKHFVQYTGHGTPRGSSIL